MKITIVGAAGGEVTGSAYYVQTKQGNVLVDCGLFQGGRKSEALNRPPTGPKQKLDAVLLTGANRIAENFFGHGPAVLRFAQSVKVSLCVRPDRRRNQRFGCFSSAKVTNSF